jgi:hypothetical protein
MIEETIPMKALRRSVGLKAATIELNAPSQEMGNDWQISFAFKLFQEYRHSLLNEVTEFSAQVPPARFGLVICAAPRDR